jgi:hypothetical protein
MARADRFDIAGFGLGDVEQGLAGRGGMAEGDEITAIATWVASIISTLCRMPLPIRWRKTTSS